MVVVRLVEKKPISVGQGNLNCPLHDAHEERVYEVNGKVVRVYVNGESASQWMNEMAIQGRHPTLPFGRKSKLLIIVPERSYGVWLNIDQAGFSQCHLWIVSEEPLESDELYFLIVRLEREFEEEMSFE
jgi:hypothetical protein